MLKEKGHRKFYKKISFLLVIIIFVMLGGYFAWSDSAGFNKVFKLVSRLLMTISIYYVFQMIVKRGAIPSFSFANVLSPMLYAVYLGLGLLSFLWSTDVSYSALQWFMDVESLVFAYYFIGSFILLDVYFPDSKIKIYRVLGHAIFMLILIFVIGYFVNPGVFMRMSHEGEEFRLGGFIMNPNELGMLSAVGVSCYIFCLYDKGYRVWTVIKILILLYGIVLTGSRSTTIGCFIIIFFHINQSTNTKLKIAMYAGAVMILPIAVSTMIVKSEGNGGLDEVMSMTGRLPFWTALLTEGLPKEPLLGYGFMRIAYTTYFSSVHTYTASMAHNTIVQVIMNLGLIGFTVVLFQLIFTFKGFLTTPEKEKKLMSLGIIIPVMINSMTEFGIFGETNYGILFYQLLIFYISMQIHKRLTPSEKIYLRHRRPELALS
ncbi:MAG TPA: O-antigen ligase family protein [Panacibacter sp.]|nr:O-antigen ligase family protein [Panacibacter sp.]